MPGPHPPTHPATLASRHAGKITIVGDLIEQRHQPRRGLPAATACTTMPRTARSTPLIRDGQRAGTAPGPVSTTAEPPSAASTAEAVGPAWASHTM